MIPSVISDEIITGVKGILYNACVTGKANTGKTIIEIDNGALSSRSPEKLIKNDGKATLTNK